MSGRVEGDRPVSDWNEMLSHSLKGHEYFYANNLGEVRIFASANEARTSHFSHRLSLDKIIDITTTKLNACSSDQELETTNRNLHLLIEKKRYQIAHPSAKEKVLRQIFRSRLGEQESRLAKAQESALPHLDIISKDVASELTDHSGRSSRLVRSLHGTDGVYFVEVLNADTIFIIKSMPAPLHTVTADRFYRQFGFQVPQYSPVYYGSSLGKEIQWTIDRRQLPMDDPRKPGSNQDEARASFIAGVEKNRYVTALKLIKGTPFNQLTKDDAIAALEDEEILKAIGRMVFLDAVIGNGDRFCMQMNLGNIILLPKEERGKEGEMPIALIDHAYKNTDPLSARRIRKNLSDYQEGTLLQEQVFLFVKHLIKTDTTANINELSKKIYPLIRAGFDAARGEFLQKFSDRHKVNELFDIQGVAAESKPDPSLFISVVESLQI